jgi:hypothetical protein
MRVYRVFTKYNIEEMLVGNDEEARQEALEQWGDKILLMMDPDDMHSIFDEEPLGINIWDTRAIKVHYTNNTPYDMNTTYQQIIQDSDKNPFFTFNNMSIRMYPNIDIIQIGVEGTLTIFMDITAVEGEILFTSLIRMIREQTAKQTGRELLGVKNILNSGTLNRNASSHVASFLSGSNGSLKRQINTQKQKTGISLAPRARKSRKARKN